MAITLILGCFLGALFLLAIFLMAIILINYHRLGGKKVTAAGHGGNRRRQARVPLMVSAEIVSADGRRLAGLTRDLSTNGMFLVGEAGAAPTGECRVALLLERPGTPIRLHLKGRVVRIEAQGLGVQFTAMDRECYENLQFIVRYNDATLRGGLAGRPLKDPEEVPPATHTIL